MGRTTFTSLLMKKTRLQVIRFLINHPDQEYTINELAKKTEVSYKTVHTLVKDLAQLGIINQEKRSAYTVISLNRDSPYVDLLHDLGSLDATPMQETASDYADELYSKYQDKIAAIVLFGSVARGMPAIDSDIDILILTKDEKDREEIESFSQSLADRYADKTGITVTPLVLTEQDFKNEMNNDSPLETRIRDEGQLLEGEQPW